MNNSLWRFFKTVSTEQITAYDFRMTWGWINDSTFIFFANFLSFCWTIALLYIKKKNSKWENLVICCLEYPVWKASLWACDGVQKYPTASHAWILIYIFKMKRRGYIILEGFYLVFSSYNGAQTNGTVNRRWAQSNITAHKPWSSLEKLLGIWA